MPRHIDRRIEEFARGLETMIGSGKSYLKSMPQAQAELGKLLTHRGLVTDLLTEVVSGKQFPQQLFHTVDSHDFVLYRSPAGSFSLRLYVWVPGHQYRIHDHGSWGILGAYVNSIRITQYRRQDGGDTPGYAMLEEGGSCVLQPGQTSTVLPFDEGIHCTQSATDQVALSIHAYGRAMRRGFIHVFDPDKKTVHRLGTPMLQKSIFAVKALGVLGKDDEIARQVLKSAQAGPRALLRWEAALARYALDAEEGVAAIEAALNDESQEVRLIARHFLDGLLSRQKSGPEDTSVSG